MAFMDIKQKLGTQGIQNFPQPPSPPINFVHDEIKISIYLLLLEIQGASRPSF